MNADILFGNVEFFGAQSAQRLRVKINEAFWVNLHDAPEGYVWATTKDPVLRVEESPGTIRVVADSVGTSELQVQVDRSIPFYLTIEVFDPNSAASLNPVVGTPILK